MEKAGSGNGDVLAYGMDQQGSHKTLVFVTRSLAIQAAWCIWRPKAKTEIEIFYLFKYDFKKKNYLNSIILF